MTTEELIHHYPCLFHMANEGTWSTIKKWGLLSTSALLDKFGINGDERFKIESCLRPKPIPISHKEYGTVVIRDQAPMREAALETCLDGLTPRQWYELLNRKAFFWVTESRVQTLLQARLYKKHEHTVITLDTASLLSRYASRVTLCPINSGSTLYVPQRRGANTFRAIADYPFSEWSKKRGGAEKAVVELTIDYSVPDLLEHTLRVERRRGADVLEQLSIPKPRA